MKEISVLELKKWHDENLDFQLIDVREEDEFEICNLANIGAELIPMGNIMQHIDKISKTKPVVVQCHRGGRSASVISVLQMQGFENLHNLKGGITAWINEVDNSMSDY